MEAPKPDLKFAGLTESDFEKYAEKNFHGVYLEAYRSLGITPEDLEQSNQAVTTSGTEKDTNLSDLSDERAELDLTEQKKQLEVAFNAAKKAYTVHLEINRAELNYSKPDGSVYRNSDIKKLKADEKLFRNESKEALYAIIDSKLLESIGLNRNSQMKLADDLNRIAYSFYVSVNGLDSDQR